MKGADNESAVIFAKITALDRLTVLLYAVLGDTLKAEWIVLRVHYFVCDWSPNPSRQTPRVAMTGLLYRHKLASLMIYDGFCLENHR